jgi:hypothetical protein
MTEEELIQHVQIEGYTGVKSLGEHGIVAIVPFMFTHAIVTELHEYGYVDRWCYSTYDHAKNALDAWDGTGEPQGWHRHPSSGRRRDSNGTETINY